MLQFHFCLFEFHANLNLKLLIKSSQKLYYEKWMKVFFAMNFCADTSDLMERNSRQQGQYGKKRPKEADFEEISKRVSPE